MRQRGHRFTVMLAAILLGGLCVTCAETDDGASPAPTSRAIADTGTAGQDSAAGVLAEAAVTLDELSSSATALDSTAVVQVGPTMYQFAASCYAPGAGDVLVLGVSPAPGVLVAEQGSQVEGSASQAAHLYLQAYLADPYVGIQLADGTLIESALESPLVLRVDGDVITSTNINFVHSLDLNTRTGVSLGTGSLKVTCSTYRVNTPQPQN